eukprot:357411-Amphidinium_carterae.1
MPATIYVMLKRCMNTGIDPSPQATVTPPKVLQHRLFDLCRLGFPPLHLITEHTPVKAPKCVSGVRSNLA